VPKGGSLTRLKWADRVLASFGKNTLGKSTFRLVWASEVAIVIGGYWEANGLFGYRRRPRYPGKLCWVLERWLSGRNYGSPATWAEATCTADGRLACGPYPCNGVYECCRLFDSVPLRPDTLIETLRTIYVNRVRSVAEAKEQLFQDSLAEEAQLDREFEERWDESHGVRRGLSFTSSGVLQNTSSEVEEYKSRLAAARVRIRREDFEPGFRQSNSPSGIPETVASPSPRISSAELPGNR
jgi:hypothetical protein